MCAASAPEGVPPARLSAPVDTPTRAVQTTSSPPQVEVAIDSMDRIRGPRAASEMTLPVIEERSAEEIGAVRDEGEHLELHLTAAPCRFIEAEAIDPEFPQTQDCRTFNASSFPRRGQRALVVSPGVYEVVVHNEAFDRPIGLWMRRNGDVDEAIISAGGIERGSQRRWVVTLEEGTYLYSCPLSPTPDYLLLVR